MGRSPGRGHNVSGQRIVAGERQGSRVALREHRPGVWIWVCDCGKQTKANRSHVKSHKCNWCRNSLDPGERFGSWIVLRRGRTATYGGSSHVVFWLCRCECGHEQEVPATTLRSGESKRCMSCNARARRKPLPKERFGLWRVVGWHSRNRWWCECECGAKRHIARSALRKGETRSCRACRILFWFRGQPISALDVRRLADASRCTADTIIAKLLKAGAERRWHYRTIERRG